MSLLLGFWSILVTAKRKAREFQFLNRLTGAHIEQLWRMYQDEWWSRGRNLNDVRRAVEHSDLICAYWDPATGRLAAFARVLTDFVYKAVIFDVIVDRPHRRRGLGRLLLEAVTSQPALLFVEHIELYCRPELVPFYKRWGFTADLNGLCFMRKRHPPLIQTAKEARRLAS
jgi:GNAT superfamily N-acetyltransferase